MIHDRETKRQPFGDYLRALIEARSMSMRDVMQRADISQQTLYRCLNYEVKTDFIEPTKRTLQSLADALEVNIEDFFRALGWIPNDLSKNATERYLGNQVHKLSSEEQTSIILGLRRSKDVLPDDEFTRVLKTTEKLYTEHLPIFARMSSWVSLVRTIDEDDIFMHAADILSKLQSDKIITEESLESVVKNPIVQDVLDILTTSVDLPSHAYKLYIVTFIEKGREVELARSVYAIWDYLDQLNKKYPTG